MTEIERQIKELKKVKKSCRVGSEERKNLNQKIKELLKKIEIDTSDVDKESLIAEILVVDPDCRKFNIDLRQYSKGQLKTHLDKMRKDKNEI